MGLQEKKVREYFKLFWYLTILVWKPFTILRIIKNAQLLQSGTHRIWNHHGRILCKQPKKQSMQ